MKLSNSQQVRLITWFVDMKNKKPLRMLLSIALSTSSLVAITATATFAADIENKDGQAYQVKVTQNGGTSTLTIQAGTKMPGICTGSCQVEVEGIGSINLSGQDTLVIENRALTIAGVANI